MKKLVSVMLALFLSFSFLPILQAPAYAASLTVGIGGAYPTLTAALAAAGNGDTVTLQSNITETVSYTVDPNKTVTIDGNGYKLTAENSVSGNSVALTVSGTGALVLRDIILQGGATPLVALEELSAGLYLPDGADVTVVSEGTVTARGGTGVSSYGVYNITGTVNITNAYGGSGANSIGIVNDRGTVNAYLGEGGTASDDYSVGAYNAGTGTINIATARGGTNNADGNSYGAWNNAGGTINVTNANGGTAATSIGLLNVNSSGTANVKNAFCVSTAAIAYTIVNGDDGSVNSATPSGGSDVSGTVNTTVAALTLDRGSGGCVLDSITVAASGSTKVGKLPGVTLNGQYSGLQYCETWYADSTLTTSFTGTTAAGGIAALYSAISSADNYTIYGTITDANSGAGLAATLQLKDRFGNSIESPVTAASDGTYTITDVPAGSYSVEASIAGYLTGTKPVTIINADSTGDDLLLFLACPAQIGSTLYSSVSEALTAAGDDDTVMLTRDVTETVSYPVEPDKTVTIDGNDYTLTAEDSISGNSVALTVSGTGTLVLKDIELQGGATPLLALEELSAGLYLPDGADVTVVSEGTVTALGGIGVSSYGVYNLTGTVNITNAYGGSGGNSIGIVNDAGTVNAYSAEGGTADDTYNAGVYNAGTGTINIATAKGGANTKGTGKSYGAWNNSGGTINVTNAYGGTAATSIGLLNVTSSGTANVKNAFCVSTAAIAYTIVNGDDGIVNSATPSGGSDVSGTVNTDVAELTLNSGSGACVLDSITVAASGSTKVGTLPGVTLNGQYSELWHTDSALTMQFTGTTVAGGTAELYSILSAANKYNISGTITDADSGAGLAASLQLKDSSGTPVGSPVTAASDGTYTITDVTAGSYSIEVSMTGYVTGSMIGITVINADLTGINTSLTLTPVAPAITTVSLLPNGETGLPYSQTLTATGDTPISWSLTAGALPGGLTLSEASGIISGTPTSAGTFNFTVEAANGTGFAAKAFTVIITDSTPPSISPATVQYDLNAPGDATTAITWNSASSVTNVVYSVRPDTTQYTLNTSDYDVDGNNFTIWNSYLAGLSLIEGDTVDFGITFNTGNTAALTVPVVGVAPATTYTITASAENGGSISPDGSVYVVENDTQVFHITPDSRYKISSVTVDGVDQGAISTYTFLNVTADHTINAAFTRKASSSGRDRSSTIAPDPDGANTFGISVSELSAEGRDAQTFHTDAGSITIPSGMLEGVAGISGSKAEISMGQGDKSKLPEDVKKAIGNRPLIELTLTIDGRQTDWSNPATPVTVSIPYKPTPEELSHPEGIVIWYIEGSGNAVNIPSGHYDPATGTVIFTTTHFSCYAVAYNKVSFTDVEDTAWYSDAVGFIAAREITTGTGGGNFSPMAKLTRGQFIVMLMKAYGIEPDRNPADNFADAGNTYYTSYLAAAKHMGITVGTGNNQFEPGREIARQEMFTLLYNALKILGQLPQSDSGKDFSGFSDPGQVSSWANEAMAHLVKTEVVEGSAGKLNPHSTTTRAEIAQVLYRLLGE